MKCRNHPLRDAQVSCCECGALLCGLCVQFINGRNFCARCLTASQTKAEYIPASSGIKLILYLVSFFIMPLGLIIGVVFYTKPDHDYNRLGRNCIVIAVAPFILYCVCFFAYAFFAFGGLVGHGLIDKAIKLPTY